MHMCILKPRHILAVYCSLRFIRVWLGLYAQITLFCESVQFLARQDGPCAINYQLKTAFAIFPPTLFLMGQFFKNRTQLQADLT